MPKKFTNKQILDILTILIKYKNLDQTIKIHKCIRRINALQTNQLLFALKLINKKSNAPTNMLKNILFNYITCDLIISRE